MFGRKGTSPLIATLARLSMGGLTQAVSTLPDQFRCRQEFPAPDGDCGLPANQRPLLCGAGRTGSKVVDGAPVIADASVEYSEMDPDLISVEERRRAPIDPAISGWHIVRVVLPGRAGKQALVLPDSEVSRTTPAMALYRSPGAPGCRDRPWRRGRLSCLPGQSGQRDGRETESLRRPFPLL